MLQEPQLLVHGEDVIAKIVSVDRRYTEIWDAILAWYAQASDLDGTELLNHLTRYGFGELVDHILAKRPFVHRAYAAGVDSGPLRDSEGLVGADLAEVDIGSPPANRLRGR